MKKTTTKNEPFTSERLFSDDALVVDYLKSLLSSAPSMILDSGERHFMHLAIDAGWKLDGTSNAVVDAPMNFDTDRLRIEADMLRNENKELKFKAELAKIDAQVLRSENHNLKKKTISQKTQLNEITYTLETLVTENNELKLQKAFLQNQVDKRMADTKSKAALMPDPVEAPEEVPLSETERIVPDDTGESAASQREEPGLVPFEPQEAVTCESSQELSSNMVLVEQIPCVDDRISFRDDLETEYISRVHFVDDKTKQKDTHEVVIGTRNRGEAHTPFQSAHPVSKIIKQQQVEKIQSHRVTVHAAKAVAPDPVQHYNASREVERTLQYAQQPLPVAEPEIRREEAPVSNKAMLLLDGTEEVDLKPAPAPKVVVRRNVKYYQDLQNEADGSNAAKEEHTIIL